MIKHLRKNRNKPVYISGSHCHKNPLLHVFLHVLRELFLRHPYKWNSQPIGNQFRRHTRNRLLPCGINIQQDHLICKIQTLCEFRVKIICTRVQMRLKGHRQPLSRPHLPNGRKRRLDLSRVMSVIININQAVTLRVYVKSSGNSFK